MISTLIKTVTADGDDYIEFVDGASSVVLDGTYDEYMFVMTDIGPATDGTEYQFQVNATDDASGDYDVSLITSTYLDIAHNEADNSTTLQYHTDNDLGQSASFQNLAYDVGSAADESVAGILHLFKPSSTTYAKQFYGRFQNYNSSVAALESYVAGYINDTTAIDEIRFKFSSGAMDGVIQLYGIS